MHFIPLPLNALKQAAPYNSPDNKQLREIRLEILEIECANNGEGCVYAKTQEGPISNGTGFLS